MDVFGRILSRQVLLKTSRRCSSHWNGFLPMLQPTATPFPQENGRPSNVSNALGGLRTHRGQINYKIAKRRDPDGIECHGFMYYPRPGEVDPPYEPTKLFMVRRVVALNGKPWWDKKMMYKLGLDDRQEIRRTSEYVIIKNTPKNCARLYKVKHLIEVVPITFPNGFPTDPTSGFLKENGEFEVYSDIGHARAKNLDEETKVLEESKRGQLDQETLKFRLRTRWFSSFDANI